MTRERRAHPEGWMSCQPFLILSRREALASFIMLAGFTDVSHGGWLHLFGSCYIVVATVNLLFVDSVKPFIIVRHHF